jgi:hypothetical protein
MGGGTAQGKKGNGGKMKGGGVLAAPACTPGDEPAAEAPAVLPSDVIPAVVIGGGEAGGGGC